MRVAGIGRLETIGLAILRRYSFAVALLLTIFLLYIYLLRSANVNWPGLAATFAPLALAALANTPSIISDGLDVSISPTMILTTAIYAVLLVPMGLGGPVSLVVLLALGGLVGMVNGLLIVRARMQPVVVTLSTSFIITGVTVLLVPTPLYLPSIWVSDLAGPQAQYPGAVILIAIPFLIWFLLGMTAFRRTLYAVGSNDVAAFASGVNVDRVRVAAYAIGGLFAAVGGLAVLATTNTVNASLSGTYTVTAFAAVALGGTSLWGGSGGLFGSLLGAASIYLLSALLITLNVEPSWLRVVSGTMLLAAVVAVGVASSQIVRSRTISG